MTIANGQFLAFTDYLRRTLRPRSRPVVWKWHDLEAMLSVQPHQVEGTLALADEHAAEPATIAPGLSLVIQVLRPGERTPSHSHSFWHLYLVRSGAGSAMTGEPERVSRIAAGDVLLVPAWCLHTIDNTDGTENLVLFRLQNLPENSRIGNLLRNNRDSMQVLYAKGNDDATDTVKAAAR